MSTSAKNHGGRVQFTVGQEVFRINLDGTATKEKYTIVEPRSDRHGLIGLKDPSTELVIRVHNSRVVPTDFTGEALVVEVADRYYVICSHCGNSAAYIDGQDQYACPSCSKTSNYRWACQKPIGKVIKAPLKRVKKEPIVADIDSLKMLEYCTIWTKKMPFDHPGIDARSYVLVYDDGESVRKLCFNTYNGKLGKKAKPLPVEDFIAGKGSGWYASTRDEMHKDLQNGKYSRIN